MKIEFETMDLNPKEAAGLVALLTITHGMGILDALERAAADDERPTIAEVVAAHAPAPGATILAPDGYPTEDPDAAAAFGGASHGGLGGLISPASTTADRDSAGIPWDERIHASTKTKTANGNWTRRRNTDDAVFNAVMAELKGGAKEATAQEAFTNPTPSAVPAPPATGGFSAPVSTPEAGDQTSSSGPSAPTTASPSDVPPPPPAAAAGPVTFPTLMVKITKAKVPKDVVDGILASFDLKGVAALAQASPDTLAAVSALVDEHVGQ